MLEMIGEKHAQSGDSHLKFAVSPTPWLIVVFEDLQEDA
jgi:hypothetical protein